MRLRFWHAPKAYAYTPLERPSEQIRLLRLSSSGAAKTLSATIEIVQLDTAPPYRAISYAWGDRKSQTAIVVDGEQVHITKNASYALRQMRQYTGDDGGPIWIDSICINQRDDDEKSAQVAIMGKIFGQAETTLACIGKSHGSDDLLHRVAAQLTAANEYNERDFTWRLPPQWLAQWVDDQSESFITSVAHAILAFFKRPYWSRLWIIQELYAGYRRHLYVLCGSLVFGWHTIIDFNRISSYLKGNDSFPSPFPNLSVPWDERGLHADALMQTLLDPPVSSETPAIRLIWASRFQCANPKDQVYGLLGLLNQVGMDPELTPDYKQSELSLALGLTGVLDDTETFHYGVLALQIPRSMTTIKTLLHARAHSDLRKKWWSEILGTIKIDSDLRGRLVSQVRRGSSGYHSSEMFPDHDWTPIFTGDKIAVMAPASTREGDLIIEGLSFCCVVRKQLNSHFQFVGRAFCIRGFGGLVPHPCPCEETKFNWCDGKSPICQKDQKLGMDLSSHEALCFVLSLLDPDLGANFWASLAGRSVEITNLPKS